MKPLNVDDLIKAGSHQWCPRCKRVLIPVGAATCQQCATMPTPPPPKTGHKSRSRSVKAPTVGEPTRITASGLAGLSTKENNSIWVIVAGKPITQGSMRMAGNTVAHAKGRELHEWRDAITVAALREAGHGWTPLDIPVAVDVCFTVQFPKRGVHADGLAADVGTPRVPPLRKPDVDKLLRAVQDGLSPRETRPGERFKLLVDDARIVDSTARKTYPCPHHTHPWALPFPGAVIRVAPLGQGIAPMPPSTLKTPSEPPEQITAWLAHTNARSA